MALMVGPDYGFGLVPSVQLYRLSVPNILCSTHLLRVLAFFG